MSMNSANDDLKKVIREIPDFPKPGILFYDITTLLAHGPSFRLAVDRIADRFASQKIDRVLAIDARGFLFGAGVAYKLGVGLAPVRKKGKLPFRTISATYELEYGSDSIEIHEDAIKPGERVLIVDDLLATGGTAGAAIELVRRSKGEVVAAAFVIELSFLHGQRKLAGIPVFSLVQYDL